VCDGSDGALSAAPASRWNPPSIPVRPPGPSAASSPAARGWSSPG
jgi:hypothetical protein